MSNKDKKNELLDEHLTKISDKSSEEDSFIFKRVGVLFVLATLIGVISVFFRPYFNDGVHVDALVSLIVVTLMNLGLLLYIIRQKKVRYRLAYNLSTIGIWAGYILGWSIGLGYLWDDIWMMNGFFALIGLGVGQLVFYLGE